MLRKLLTLIVLVGMSLTQVQGQNQKKNDEQPTRFNYKKLTSDPNSEFYNKNIKKPKDNVIERYNYNFERLKNPETGKIPNNIQDLELQYVKSQRSQLQKNSDDLPKFKNGINIRMANGEPISPWVNRGPYNVGGRTRALAIDMDDENIILAGGVSGGMWRSTNQGISWQRVTATDQHPTVTDVEQDPRPAFNDTWYYSSGERIGASQSARSGNGFLQGNGVYKSTDNGLSWSVLTATANNTPQSFDNAFDLIFNIEVNPVNGDLYVATFFGIYRSTDGGTSFSRVLTAEFDNFSDIHITNSGVIYAALDNGEGNGGIYRTTDGAADTWTNITDDNFPASFGRTVLYTAPSDEDVLYVLASGTPTAPVGHDFWKYTYISGDGTATGGDWIDRSANLPNIGGSVGSFNSQGGYDIYVRVHPTDPNMVFIGGTNIYRSNDAFATNSGEWIAGYSPLNNVSLYTNHHPDQHSLEFFPSDPSKVISGHDGGVSITTDILAKNAGAEPVSWTSLNNGYLTTQVYALSIGPEDQLMAGFQDNSTWFTNNSIPTDSWVDVFSGDGSYNAFNSDGTVRYVSSQTGNVYKLIYPDANSASYIAFQALSPAEGSFVAPFELDPNNDQIMYYAALNGLWRNNDLANATNTTGWDEIATGAVSTIGISTQPANIVYFGTTSGQIYRIENANTGNPTVEDIFTAKGLPGGNVSSISVDPYDADDAIVTFSNYGIKSVFQTIDGGTTWSDISGNLEENSDGSGSGPSVRWAARIGNNDRYFIATSTGLYSTATLNGTSTVWTQENMEGISNAVVEQLRTRNSDGLVVAGTHGNGLFSTNYEVSQPDVLVDEPLADFTVDANAADTTINVSSVFKSNTNPAQTISVSVESNTNSGLILSNISGNDLTLSFIADQFGEATIVLKGTDENGEVGFSEFTIFVTPPPVTLFPYMTDFEGGISVGWGTSGPMAWVLGSGGTPTSNTGPVLDHTLGNAVGTFLFSESSNQTTGDEAILVSRKIDLKTLKNPRLQFYYHMFGAGIGALKVEIKDLTNSITAEVFSVSGAQQIAQDDRYLSPSPVGLDLSQFGSSIIEVNFIAIRGNDFTSDVAIDDIEFYDLPSEDLGVTDISISNSPFYGSSETVSIEITNYGSNDQTNFDVSYALDGANVITETIEAIVLSGETIVYDFTTTLDLTTVTQFEIEAFTSLAGDLRRSNDSSKSAFIKATLVSSFPYVESFESSAGNWYSDGTNSSWELGEPVATVINSASDGLNSWGTNLDGNYNDLENSSVYSPYFDLSTFTYPVLQLDIWSYAEIAYDGTIIEYTTDRGDTWIKLGDFGDPDNWYTSAEVASYGNQSAWDFTSDSQWLKATHSLLEVVGEAEVGFRIHFVSDNFVSEEGFAFDNFKLFDLATPQNLAAANINTGSFDISWAPVQNTENYLVSVSEDNFSTFVAGYENLKVSSESFEIRGLSPDTQYDVKIQAAVTENYASNFVLVDGGVRTLALPEVTVPTNLTTNSFTANWKAYIGANSYKLEVSSDGFSTNLSDYDLVDVSGTSLEVTGLDADTDYQYRISADLGFGVTEPSEPVSTANVLQAPSGLEWSENDMIVELIWTDNSDNEEAFVIERKAATETMFSQLASIEENTTSFNDETIELNTSYTYRVYAFNSFGSSNYSNVVTAIIESKPNQPTDLVAEFLNGEILLVWEDNSTNEVSLEIERKVGKSDFQFLASLESNSTEYTDVLDVLGEDISYRVYAKNAVGYSEYSNVAVVPMEITSNKEDLLSSAVKISPNPSEGVVRISVGNEYKVKSVKVVDLSGRLVLSKELLQPDRFSIDYNSYNLNLSEQKVGLYLLYIETIDNQMTIKKIIKN